MPSCRPDVIPGVIYEVMKARPKTILDVGIGNGKWAVLCDEYLRYWSTVEPVIDGVEAHEPYKSSAHAMYREIFYCDVMELVRDGRIANYDMVLLVDVIEHLTKKNGKKLLKQAKKYVVSTPNYWAPQEALFGNVYERHISKWEVGDFDNYKLTRDAIGREYILGWRR